MEEPSSFIFNLALHRTQGLVHWGRVPLDREDFLPSVEPLNPMEAEAKGK